MRKLFEVTAPAPVSRVESRQNPDGSLSVAIPPEITEEWTRDFTEDFGQEEYEAVLSAEDWLVQRPDGNGVVLISSASYELEDRVGPTMPVIKGRVWDAGITPTPQYVEGWTSPVISLLDARLIRGDTEEPIPADPAHLVLVRLDRFDGTLALNRIDDSPPAAA